MNTIKLRIKRLPHCIAVPTYASAGAAGLDMCAALSTPVTLEPGARMRIPTGVIIEVPEGYEGQVVPRSGLADRAGISLTNCVGTIDSDYRGEVQVLVINHGEHPHIFRPGDRVAQLVLVPIPKVEVVEVDELTESVRGAGGLGSSGTGKTSAYHQKVQGEG